MWLRPTPPPTTATLQAPGSDTRVRRCAGSGRSDRRLPDPHFSASRRPPLQRAAAVFAVFVGNFHRPTASSPQESSIHRPPRDEKTAENSEITTGAVTGRHRVQRDGRSNPQGLIRHGNQTYSICQYIIVTFTLSGRVTPR